MQILIPVDDMNYTLACLYSVQQRKWPEGTRVILGRVIEDCSEYGNSDIKSVSSETLSLTSDTYYNLQKSEKWLEDLAKSLSIENCEINTALLMGDVAEQLANLANEFSIDYIIIGSHKRSASTKDWLVSIASSVTDKVKCSVEIVRPRALRKMLKNPDLKDDEISKIDYSPKRVVLATDFSNNSRAALNWVGEIGFAPDTKFAVIAVEPPVSKGLVDMKLRGELDGSRTTQLKVEDIRMKLDAEADILSSRLKKKVSETQVLKGDPATKILEYSKDWEADLLVIGAHGATAAYELTMGSTTRSIINGSSCSIAAIESKHWTEVSFQWKPAEN